MKQKTFYLFLVVIFSLQSCHAQKNKNTHIKKTEKMNAITKNFETFDNNKYKELEKVNHLYQSEFLQDGTYIEMLKSNSGNVYRETPKESYFTITKGYYTNGNIHGKGLFFNLSWSGFQKGIWYEFDESGKLIKEIDYDKPYDFTFEDILKFCEREKIPLQKGPILQSTGYHTVIKRDYNAHNSWWIIERLKQSDIIEVITLDGDSGKILKRENREYINN